MKVVAISDTHGFHDQIEIPECDILCHAGDLTMRGSKSEVVSFLNWFSKQKAKYKIFIAGNHDFFFDHDWRAYTDYGKSRHKGKQRGTKEEIAELLALYPDITYLNDSMIEVEGIKIWGSPIQPWFHDWAFNRKPSVDIKPHWDLIPEKVDIIITHGPPYDYGDLVVWDGRKVGCSELRSQIHFRIKPQVHICGHIHEGYGVVEDCNVKFINASVLNEHYYNVNKPVEFEINIRK